MAQYRPSIPKLKPLARMFSGQAVKPQPKRADPIYKTPEFERWRRFVLERAGYRCEARVGGKRCHKAQPDHRMFADHVKEISDGGLPFDPMNGQCLCGSHHTVKTMAERAKRLGQRG